MRKKKKKGFTKGKPLGFEIESATWKAAARPPRCWAGGGEQGEHLILDGSSLDLPNWENKRETHEKEAVEESSSSSDGYREHKPRRWQGLAHSGPRRAHRWPSLGVHDLPGTKQRCSFPDLTVEFGATSSGLPSPSSCSSFEARCSAFFLQIGPLWNIPFLPFSETQKIPTDGQRAKESKI